jgi:hypothetical protein
MCADRHGTARGWIDRVEVDSGVIERKPLSRGIRCNSIEANDDF